MEIRHISISFVCVCGNVCVCLSFPYLAFYTTLFPSLCPDVTPDFRGYV